MKRTEQIRAECDALAKEKAKRYGMAAWYESAGEVLTEAEKVEVRAMWDGMSGESCWTHAFFRWMADPSVNERVV
jgi:hypothetical protein